MDDMWMTISGSFGQLQLGEHDSAPMMMVTGYQGSWATQTYNLAFERGEIVPAPSGFGNAGPQFGVREDLGDSDDPKITYMSPRFGGFQIGGSYMRDAGAASESATTSQVPNAGIQDFYAFAANFSQKVGGMTVGFAAGYLQNYSGAIGDDIKGYVAGLSIASGPFKVAFGVNSNDDPTVGAGSVDGISYDAGIGYTSGAHRFGVAVFKGQTAADTTVTGDDESSTFWFSHRMGIGPGVQWDNAIGWTDWDGEGTGATEDQNGWGAATSIQINF
jgi:hypothetical protein